MQRVVQVPSALIMALNGLVVVFVVSSEIWRKKRQRKRMIGFDESEPDEDEPDEGHPPNLIESKLEEAP